MLALIFFFMPALWIGVLLGMVFREGLAALLYYRLADLTPFLLANWDSVVTASLVLGVVGNILLSARIKWGHWCRTQLALVFVLLGGCLWLVACMLQPDWWLAPLGGLGVFAVFGMFPLASLMMHYAMLRDDIVVVLAWLALFLAVAAVLHVGVMGWLG